MSDRRASGFPGRRARAFLLFFAVGGLVPLACTLQTSGLGGTGAGGRAIGSSTSASTTATTATTATSGTGGATTSATSATTSTSSGSTPVCGNSVVEAGEECDDGNTNNNDACLNTCKNAKCGDSVVETGVEECDDGNTNNNDACLNTCKNAKCGDGFVEAGVEECDDGNASNTDACLNTCKKAKCGDSVIQTGVEQCDDGNATPGDHCGATCQIEDPTTCPGTPISLVAGQMLTINDSTNNASDKFVGSPSIGNCNQSTTWPGSDLVYAVTPATSGMLTASLTAAYSNNVVHVRPSCPGASQDDLDCHYGLAGGVTDTIHVTVSAGVTYYVAADSWQNQSGSFKLTLQLQ